MIVLIKLKNFLFSLLCNIKLQDLTKFSKIVKSVMPNSNKYILYKIIRKDNWFFKKQYKFDFESSSKQKIICWKNGFLARRLGEI